MSGKWKDVVIQIDEDTDPIAIKIADRAIGIIRSREGCSYHEAIKQALIEGLLANKHVTGNPEIDRWAKEREFMMSACREAKEGAHYVKMYKLLGPERFVEKANEMGLDLERIEKFLDHHRVPITSWYDKVKRWLSSMLFVWGGSATVDTIRLQAIQCGLLADPDVDPERYNKEWASIKTCAGELGLTSREHKGYWKAIADDEQLPLQ